MTNWTIIGSGLIGAGAALTSQLIAARTQLRVTRDEHQAERRRVADESRRAAVVNYLSAADHALSRGRSALLTRARINDGKAIAQKLITSKAILEFWMSPSTIQRMAPFMEAVTITFNAAQAPVESHQDRAAAALQRRGWSDSDVVDGLRAAFLKAAWEEIGSP